ncbi:MAG: hypothetical protein CSA20_08785 [Deltaproteobacteria bacterium]|nr:MAG: hypothetical protein CSA20_08785 [Deltaproteobacteria bacterium]
MPLFVGVLEFVKLSLAADCLLAVVFRSGKKTICYWRCNVARLFCLSLGLRILRLMLLLV